VHNSYRAYCENLTKKSTHLWYFVHFLIAFFELIFIFYWQNCLHFRKNIKFICNKTKESQKRRNSLIHTNREQTWKRWTASLWPHPPDRRSPIKTLRNRIQIQAIKPIGGQTRRVSADSASGQGWESRRPARYNQRRERCAPCARRVHSVWLLWPKFFVESGRSAHTVVSGTEGTHPS